jgi:hypothetical protein
MSLYFSNTGARRGSYDEEIGIDIDSAVVGDPGSAPGSGDYYDYDLLSRPNVGVSGSGIIISPPDGGLPSIDDYITNPDGSKQLKQFISDDQSETLNTMLGDVNNGRLSDIEVVKEVSVPEGTDIVIKKDNNDTSIKGILEQNSVNDIFFSEMNTKVVQDTIRYKVHQNTQQVISEQSTNDLYIIMRSIMLQFANFRIGVDNIVDEVRRLNAKVVEYSVENISSNVKQHQGYVKDLAKLPTPMDMPVYHNKRNFTYDISNIL